MDTVIARFTELELRLRRMATSGHTPLAVFHIYTPATALAYAAEEIKKILQGGA
jgi:hypothetical protein